VTAMKTTANQQLVSRVLTVALALQVAGPFLASAEEQLDSEPPGVAVTSTDDDLLCKRP